MTIEAPVAGEPIGTRDADYVRRMFDCIAPRYDILNSILSFNTHHAWRVFAARCASIGPGDSVLDVCTGTGDLAVELRKRVGAAGRVAAVDFSQAMLDAGEFKFSANGIETKLGDAMALPYGDDEFHACVVGFGIRNVADPSEAAREMMRVVRPGGHVVVLEFSQPVNPLFRASYDLHSRLIMPWLGSWVSGHSDAYRYLPESVRQWKSRDEMTELLAEAGLVSIRSSNLTFGVVCVHVGEKPSE